MLMQASQGGLGSPGVFHHAQARTSFKVASFKVATFKSAMLAEAESRDQVFIDQVLTQLPFMVRA